MIRELTQQDIHYYQDLLSTLAHLSEVKPLSTQSISDLLGRINKQDGHIFVYIKDNQVVSTVTLFIEQKITHGGGLAGHVEDVVTRVGYEGLGYSSATLAHAIAYGKERGCYKIVLYCKKELQQFYEKNLFTCQGVQMEMRP